MPQAPLVRQVDVLPLPVEVILNSLEVSIAEAKLSASRRTRTAASLRDDPVGSRIMREAEFLLRLSDGRIGTRDQLDRFTGAAYIFSQIEAAAIINRD